MWQYDLQLCGVRGKSLLTALSSRQWAYDQLTAHQICVSRGTELPVSLKGLKYRGSGTTMQL
jgi:hypothetical protein